MSNDDDDEIMYVSQFDGSYCGFVHQRELYNVAGRHIGMYCSAGGLSTRAVPISASCVATAYYLKPILEERGGTTSQLFTKWG
jgi:hypothetical protein